MDDPGTVQVLLHLDPVSQIIHGWTADLSGRTVEFHGWLELSALLDRLRTDHRFEPVEQPLTEAMPWTHDRNPSDQSGLSEESR
jgi:hypothetical protein